MAIADLKNDFVFRRVFADHADILRGLLNDLLDRRGDQTIEVIEHLPSEQLPLVPGAKLSILDVRCRDRSGATFIVEMQLLHVSGFVNRVVYNACKAYAGQLNQGDPYTRLADVVAISICDFALWPDSERDGHNLPRVPMLSHWSMTEEASGAKGLLQVQYAFLELPKLPPGRPKSGADLWAWLFVHAPELSDIPEDLPPGPHRSAVELANQATFKPEELEAYRRVIDEIQQAREYGDERWAQGKVLGQAEGKAQAILAVLAARGISVSVEIQEIITACKDNAALDRWISRAAIAATAGEVIREADP